MAEYYSIIHMYHIFIQSSVNRHLGCFHVFTIVNSAAVNTGPHVSFWIMFFSGCMPRSGIAGSYGSSVFNLIATPKWLCQFTFPPTLQEDSLLSTPSPAFIVGFFDDSHSGWCQVIAHCSFHLHFSNNEWCWASFHVFVGHLYVFFG